MSFALGGAAGLEALSRTSFEVVFSDMRMPELDGLTFFARVRAQHPSALRVLLSGQTDIEAGVLAVPVAHQFLTKPCDQAAIAERVENVQRLHALLADPALRAFAGGVNGLPCLDATRSALVTCLVDPACGTREVAAIVETDIALSIKLVQLAGSSFFATPCRITSVAAAIGRLGLDVIRALVLTGALFSAERFELRAGFSVEEFNHSAARSANAARARCVDAAHGDGAYLGELVRHAGTLLLAARGGAGDDDDAHANIAGAYLLGLWGLPSTLVEMAACRESGIQDHSAEPGSWRRAA